MDRIELKKRLNVSCPVIDKQMLRGGMDNRNLRKEIDRFSKEYKSFNENKSKVELGGDFKVMKLSSASVSETKEPRLKKLRITGWA